MGTARQWWLGAVVVALLLGCAPGAAPAAKPATTAPPPAALAAPVAASAAAPPAAPAALPTAASAPAPTPLSPPVKLVVGVLAISAQAPFLIAEERGYFQEEGLEVELQRFDSGARMVAPLAAGQIQAGMGSHSAGLFNALSTGVALKIVASNSFNAAGRSPSAIAVRKDLYDQGFRSGPDLRGKNVAVTAVGTTVHANVGRYLEQYGLRTSDVNIVELSQPDMNVALANGGVDLANQTEPLVIAGADQGILVRLHGIDEVFPDREASVVMYGQQFIEEQPEAARRLMAAYLRAVRDFEDAFSKNQNREAMLDLLIAKLPIRDKSLWLKMHEQGTLIYFNPDGRPNGESIAWDQDWMVAQGLVRAKVDMTQVIDNRWVDAAVERLGRYAR